MRHVVAAWDSGPVLWAKKDLSSMRGILSGRLQKVNAITGPTRRRAVALDPPKHLREGGCDSRRCDHIGRRLSLRS